MVAEGAFAGLGHAVEGFAGEFRAEVERRGSGGECHGVLAADFIRDEFFQFVDVRTDCAHPVGIISLHHISGFLSVHSRTGEIDMFFKRNDLCRAFKGHFLYSSASSISDPLRSDSS